MPNAKRTVAVELTRADIEVLRRLIIDEAKRLGYHPTMTRADMPARLIRMNPVATKVRRAAESMRGQATA